MHVSQIALLFLTAVAAQSVNDPAPPAGAITSCDNGG